MESKLKFERSAVVKLMFQPTTDPEYMRAVSLAVANIAEKMFSGAVASALKADGLPNDPDGVSMHIAGITFQTQVETQDNIEYLRHRIFKRDALVATVSVEPPPARQACTRRLDVGDQSPFVPPSYLMLVLEYAKNG
jgi:hypothetical protein